MARKPKEQLEGEGATASEPPPKPTPKKAPPPKPTPKKVVSPEPPRVQLYRVTAVPPLGRVHVKGVITKMNVGRVIDPRGYHLKTLRDQGVVLESIKDE